MTLLVCEPALSCGALLLGRTAPALSSSVFTPRLTSFNAEDPRRPQNRSSCSQVIKLEKNFSEG